MVNTATQLMEDKEFQGMIIAPLDEEELLEPVHMARHFGKIVVMDSGLEGTAGGHDDLANAAAGAIQLATSFGREPSAAEVADVFAMNLTLTHPASWRMDK